MFKSIAFRRFFFVSLLLISICAIETRSVRSQSSDDCTQHTSPVALDGTKCKNYVFTGVLNQLSVTGTSSVTLDGIYFAPGSSCTGCTFDLKGVTINNMIYGGTGFSFSGGSLSLDGIKSPIIAFEGMMFSGSAAIKIVNCQSSFSTDALPSLHPIYNSAGWFPPFIFGIRLVTSGLNVASLDISGNRISAVNTTSTLPFAFVVQGIVQTSQTILGDFVSTTAVVARNEVNCTGCITAAFVVSLQAKTPTSDTDALSIGTLFNVSANKVSSVISGDSSSSPVFVCNVISVGFVAPSMIVTGNTCKGIVEVRSNIPIITALEIGVPKIVLATQFGISFGQASESGSVEVSRNSLNVSISPTSSSDSTINPISVIGLAIRGYLPPQLTLVSNNIEVNSPSSSASGIVIDPRAVMPFSKYSPAWAKTDVGCVTSFGSCAMPQSILTLRLNIVKVTGGYREVVGFYLPPLGLRVMDLNLMGTAITLPTPMVFPSEIHNNQFYVTSTNGANRTKGIAIGDEFPVNMVLTSFSSEANTIVVNCGSPTSQNAFPLGAICAGFLLNQGMSNALIKSLIPPSASMYASFINLDFFGKASGTYSDLMTVTCYDNFNLCAGFIVISQDFLTTFDVTINTASLKQIEVGDQDISAAGNSMMKLSAPMSFIRVGGAAASKDFTLTVDVSTKLDLDWTQQDVRKATANPRALMRFDSASKIVPKLKGSGWYNAYVTRRFRISSEAQTNNPAVFSLPYSGATGPDIDVTNLYATQTDWCEIGGTADPIRYYKCTSKGSYTRIVRADPAATSVTTSRLAFTNVKFRGFMRRKCPNYFFSEFTTGCSGCALKIGCSGCSDAASGIASSASSWNRVYFTSECPVAKTHTLSKTPVPPPNNTKTSSRSQPITDSDSRSLVPTNTRTHVSTRTYELPPTDTLPLTKSKSFSLSIPNCFPGINVVATISTPNSATTRFVERETVRIIMRILPPRDDMSLSSMWDVIGVGNVTTRDVTILAVDDAKQLDLVSAKLIGVRTVEIFVKAQPGTNSFRDDVAGRFRLNTKILKCRWNSTASLETKDATRFIRRFPFLPAPATSAVVGLGVSSMYIQSLLLGSSGISFWYAARRSIGFFDAVSCLAKKDSLLTIIDSPLQLQLGTGPNGASRGAVIGNGVIAFVFIAIVLGFAVFRSTSTWKPLFNIEAMNWAGAPNWFLPVCCILLPGSMQAVVEMFAGGNGIDIGLAIFFGLVLVVLTPLYSAKVLFPSTRFFFLVKSEEYLEKIPNPNYDPAFRKKLLTGKDYVDPKNNNNNNDDDDENDEMMFNNHNNNNNNNNGEDDDEEMLEEFYQEQQQQQQTKTKSKHQGKHGNNKKMNNNKTSSSPEKIDPLAMMMLGEDVTSSTIRQKPKSFLKRFLSPTTVYKTLHQHFINRYGVLFDRNTPALYWVTFADIIISFVAAIIAGWPTDRQKSPSSCRNTIIAHIIVAISGLFLMGLCPFTSRFDNVIILVVYAVGLVNAIVSIVADLKDDDNLNTAADGIAFAILILCFVKVLVDAFRLWKVYQTWQIRRLIDLVTRRNSDEALAARKREKRRKQKRKDKKKEKQEERKNRGGGRVNGEEGDLSRSGSDDGDANSNNDDDDDDDQMEGDSVYLGDDYQRKNEEMEMKRREREEEREIQMIERRKQLSRRTLPPPMPKEPEDLTNERRRRQQLVEPMLEELAAAKKLELENFHKNKNNKNHKQNNNNDHFPSSRSVIAKHPEEKNMKPSANSTGTRRSSNSSNLNNRHATANNQGADLAPSFSSVDFGPSLNVGGVLSPSPTANTTNNNNNNYNAENQISLNSAANHRGDIPASLLQFVRKRDSSSSSPLQRKPDASSPFSAKSPTIQNNSKKTHSNDDDDDSAADHDLDDEAWLIRQAKKRREAIEKQQKILQEQQKKRELELLERNTRNRAATAGGFARAGGGANNKVLSKEDKMALL